MNTSSVVTDAVRCWLKRERLTQMEGAEALEMALSTMKSKLIGQRRWNMAELDRLVDLGVIEPVTAKESA